MRGIGGGWGHIIIIFVCLLFPGEKLGKTRTEGLICFYYNGSENSGEGKSEGVGVMKDKDLKLDETNTSISLV